MNNEKLTKFLQDMLKDREGEAEINGTLYNFEEIVEMIEGLMISHNYELMRIVYNAKGNYFKKSVSNWKTVQELIQDGTSQAGRTSSIEKAKEIGLNPYDTFVSLDWRNK